MATDEERHEVAQRLREFSRNTWQLTVGGNSATIRYAISDIVFGDKKYHSGVDLLNRLADLIDPPLQCPLYHSDRHYCSIYEDVDVIDRDRLLTLAEGLDNKADDIIRAAQHAKLSKVGPTMDEAKHEACEWRGIARRIREALGV